MTVYHFATFNLRCSAANDGQNSWVHRREQVQSLMRHYEWDAVGMQEVSGEQRDWLSGLPGYGHEGIGREDDRESEHSSIFYREDRFERLDGGTFWLTPTPEVRSVAWNSACTRICTWVKLRDRRDGRTLAFVNTHLDHMSEEARFEGARVILKWISENAADEPVVLTGDVNATPDERCYREITASLTDTKRADGAEHYGPLGTFHGWKADESWAGFPEIDYVFVSAGIRTLKTRTNVDCVDRRYPSDHFPVEAWVDIGDRQDGN